MIWRYYVGNQFMGIGTSPAVADSLVFFSTDHLISGHYGTMYALRVFPSQADTVYWKYAGFNGVMSSAAIAYGRVYVGMEADGIITRGLVCFKERPTNPPNAEIIWRYYPTATRSSSAVANGKVYVSGGSTGSKIYCFNALSNTAETVWTYNTGGEVFSSPAIANGMMFVGSFDHYVYGFGTPYSAVLESNSNPIRIQSMPLTTLVLTMKEWLQLKKDYESKHIRFHLFDCSGRIFNGRLKQGIYFIKDENQLRKKLILVK
jgi:outer membrane protein assembly factor BamB